MGSQCRSCHADNPEGTKFCGQCGARLESSSELTLSLPAKTRPAPVDFSGRQKTLAGKYRIIEPIGKGGMGVVYKAEDAQLERLVALKFLPTELTEDPEARERFVLEAKAAAALSHPHICTVYEINETGTEPFIAMEFVEGQNLRQVIAEKRLNQAGALDMAIQLAEGLEEAHQKGIVHRDIKPGNIMVTPAGQAKIMDFGLAKISGRSLITREATTLGTVAYMSPEQAQGKSVDHRTDLWSLGVVIYEMLTGELPFAGERDTAFLYSIVHAEPKSLDGRIPPIPSELKQVVQRALKKDPESRYQSASEILQDLRRYQEMLRAAEAGVFNLHSFLKRLRQPKFAILTAVSFLAVAALAIWFFARQSKIRYARNVLLPKIGQLMEAGALNRLEAGELSLEAQKYLPHDPKLAEYVSKATIPTSIETEPPGARVYLKEYKAPEREWRYLGITPIENTRLPVGFFQWKMEKEGYETVFAASPSFDDYAAPGRPLFSPCKIVRMLDKKGTLPAGMVRVKGGSPLKEVGGMLVEPGIEGIGELSDFFIDKYEVTNRQFKEFVDKGGYRDRRYWKEKFIKDGKELAWGDAVKEFVDQTGQPGPSTWQGGDYPEGQDDYPVSGVSWYEAAAYAEFQGKSLPTTSHWGLARGALTPFIQCPEYLDLVAPLSNFQGHGPAPVGKNAGITSFGAYDMAGNVREWCRNAARQGRVIRGGGWRDVPYMFAFGALAFAFDRTPDNGFRCVLDLEPEKIPKQAFDSWLMYEQDYSKEKPVTDSVFQVYKEQFSYDELPLNARVEWRNDTAEDWIQEKITFDAAYENERMMAYLFLPKGSSPPFQIVVYFSGAAEYQRSSENLDKFWDFENSLTFVLKNGRAVLFPIYKGTFERGSDALTKIIDGDSSKRQYAEVTIKIAKDLRRSIDYLQTRPEIDRQRIAYMGMSWGGWLGIIFAIADDRLKTCILQSGGLFPGFRPEISPINYLPRVKIPTLMLNGRYDLIFPYETNSRVAFGLLGTPKERKEQKLFDSGHLIPRNELIKETLRWLDKYLGPVT